MEVHGLTYKLFVAVELGIFITAGTLPIIVLVVFFSKTYMQVHKKLMLQIMSEGIAAHHLLCLFVQLAIDKNQWLIKIERK